MHAKARQAVDDTRKGEFVERKEKAEKEGGGFTAGAVPLYSERLTARRMVNHFLKLMRLFILTSFIEGGNGDEQSAKSAERWEKSKLAKRADVTKGIQVSEDLIFSPVLTRIDWSRYIEKTEEEAEMKSRDEETRDTEMREVAANPPPPPPPPEPPPPPLLPPSV